jgi:hypothetical protein
MMQESVFEQVAPFIPLAVKFIEAKFGVAEKVARNVVQDVLTHLLSKQPEKLGNPKRYLLRHSRWKALRSIRRRPHSEEAPEILIALEEQDRERFFGRSHAPAAEPLRIICEEHQPLEVSATLEAPGTVVRVSFSLSKLNNKAS